VLDVNRWTWTLAASTGDGLTEQLAAIASRFRRREGGDDLRLAVLASLEGHADVARFTAGAAVLGRLADLPADLILDLYPPTSADALAPEFRLVRYELQARVGHVPDWRTGLHARDAVGDIVALQMSHPATQFRVPSGLPAHVSADEHVQHLTRLAPYTLELRDTAVLVSFAASAGQGSVELSPASQRRLAELRCDVRVELLSSPAAGWIEPVLADSA